MPPTHLNDMNDRLRKGDKNITEQSFMESERTLNDDIQIRGHKSKSISRIPKPKKNMLKNVGRVDNYSEEKINKYKKTRQECDKIGEKDDAKEGILRKENSEHLSLENEYNSFYVNVHEEPVPSLSNLSKNERILCENSDNIQLMQPLAFKTTSEM